MTTSTTTTLLASLVLFLLDCALLIRMGTYCFKGKKDEKLTRGIFYFCVVLMLLFTKR